jgi:SagB-type dehydrogenase family enzyme
LLHAIERRGSARRFSRASLEPDALQTVVGAAQGHSASDQAAASALVRPLLIVNRVEGLESGAYVLDASGEPLLLREGDFEADAGHLALDQQAASDAAVNLYFVASQAEVAAAMGERGYRAVQLEAGVRVGQAYLAASSLGLKATGLTFYDDEVASFFGLDQAETLVLMLVVFGP